MHVKVCEKDWKIPTSPRNNRVQCLFQFLGGKLLLPVQYLAAESELESTPPDNNRLNGLVILKQMLLIVTVEIQFRKPD